MNIKTFSEQVGISAHTLRYYDKLGLLGNICRTASGHRDFSEKDIEWIRFIQRLKATGMPIEQILAYTGLRANGDSTLHQRLKMLRKHKEQLDARIAGQLKHREMLEEKIAWYEAAVHSS